MAISERYIEHRGEKWRIARQPSIFTFRSGRRDVYIMRESDWGARESDGRRYMTCQRLAAEDGSLLRNYEAIPGFMTSEWLREQGFVDHACNI